MRLRLAVVALLVVPAGLFAASEQFAALDEPANVDRAVARLRLRRRHVVGMLRRNVDSSSKAYRPELKRSRLAADLFGVSACTKIVAR